MDGIPGAEDAPDCSFLVVWPFFPRRSVVCPKLAGGARTLAGVGWFSALSPHPDAFSRGAQIFNRPRQPRAKTASQQPAASFSAHPLDPVV